jgi:RES domain
MSYTEIFDQDFFKLPTSVYGNESFRDHIQTLFMQYFIALRSLRNEKIKLKNLAKSITGEWLYQTQIEFMQGLQDSLDIYLSGNPYGAYSRLDKSLNKRLRSHKNMLSSCVFEKEESFYRIRRQAENYPLTALEQFHIPFESRGNVKSNRFSIPGFPSLYLSKTLYLCWEELRRPNYDSIQAIRFSLNENIECLDLTIPDLSDKSTTTAYKYFITWPLIALTSVRAKFPNDQFKPEYIFPQLLLQWIRNNKEWAGIKYNSTHIHYDEKTAYKYQNYNVVMPVKTNQKNGHCPELKKLFSSSQSISFQLMNIALGGEIYLNSDTLVNDLDKKLPQLEFHLGKKYPYSHTLLGKMELFLDGLSVTKL